MKLTPDTLRALNSITKYPSIETFHVLAGRGQLTEECTPPPGPVIVTEKVDGTNARIVLLPSGSGFLIGSREEWLTFSDDVVRNPQLGIVDAVLHLARDLVSMAPASGLRTLYGEVYGGKINGARAYTNTGVFGFRLFDVATLGGDAVDELLAMPLDEIAKWREGASWRFADEDTLERIALHEGLLLTPRLARDDLVVTSIAATSAWLNAVLGETHCSLDGEAGRAEGVVIRTPDRSYIRKLRFEDYERTLRGRQ